MSGISSIKLGLIALVFCLNACKGDGSRHLINGYELVYTSSDAFFIIYSGKIFEQRVRLEARVDDIKIEGDNILVARTPQEVYINEQGISVYRMLPICEYWLIDTKKDTLLKVDNINVVHCK